MVELRVTVKKTHRSTPRFSAGTMYIHGRDTTPPLCGCRPSGHFPTESFKAFDQISVGDVLVVNGVWEDDSRWGHQFKIVSFRHDLPLDTAGLVRFIADHPAMVGIGEIRARRVVDVVGAENFAHVLVEEPQRIADAAGIKLERVLNARTAWLMKRSENEDRVKLSAFNLTPWQQNQLLEKYKSAATVIRVLNEQPYELLETVTGFGWKIVDTIARRLGRQIDDPERVRAGILVVIDKQLHQFGHTWVHRDEVVEQAADLLDIGDFDLIADGVFELVEADKLVPFLVDGLPAVAGSQIFRQECEIRSILTSRASLANAHFDADEIANLALPVELNDAQREAVLAAADENALLLTGGAGSGKTYTIKSIVQLYTEENKKIALVAPTGKAAKRIAEVTGHTASTIHRFLGWGSDDEPRNYEEEEYRGEELRHRRVSPEDADVVIIDEFSMTDVPLFYDLLTRIDLDCSIVLVGDHNQLASVGPGCVLRDLVMRQPIRHIVLDKIVRQAGVLKENSAAILQGIVLDSHLSPKMSDTPWLVSDLSSDELRGLQIIEDFWNTILPRDFGLDVLRDVQFLVPTKKGTFGARRLNMFLQNLVQRTFGVEVPQIASDERDFDEDDEDERSNPVKFYVHDRVIHTKNNYQLGVMNGEVGRVKEIDKNGNIVVVFDDDEQREVLYYPANQKQLQLAYALTIHKYQGSQIRCAVVVMNYPMRMNTKNLLYTAVTRAQKTAILLGQRSVFNEAAHCEDAMQRRTLLSVIDWPQSRKPSNGSSNSTFQLLTAGK